VRASGSGEEAGDREEGLPDGVRGQPEFLESDGTEQRQAPGRSCEKDGDDVLPVELDRHLAGCIGHALATCQGDGPFTRCRESELGDDFLGEHGPRGTGVHQEVKSKPLLRMLGAGQASSDEEGIHVIPTPAPI